MDDRRNNWKQEIAEENQEHREKRQTLLSKKGEISEKLKSLTIEERRSNLYIELKKQEREILAQLATL